MALKYFCSGYFLKIGDEYNFKTTTRRIRIRERQIHLKINVKSRKFT